MGSGISDKALADLITRLRPLCESAGGSIVFVEPTTEIEVSY
ncbi:MAG TPA: hypothetical protein VLK23_01205 [Thermodesulfobacteriota bacterium]|nr:hypothetical protein [Thermodesulfobacteriota bacterium]